MIPDPAEQAEEWARKWARRIGLACEGPTLSDAEVLLVVAVLPLFQLLRGVGENCEIAERERILADAEVTILRNELADRDPKIVRLLDAFAALGREAESRHV